MERKKREAKNTHKCLCFNMFLQGHAFLLISTWTDMDDAMHGICVIYEQNKQHVGMKKKCSLFSFLLWGSRLHVWRRCMTCPTCV